MYFIYDLTADFKQVTNVGRHIFYLAKIGNIFCDV